MSDDRWMTERYDVIVVGSGAGGLLAALRLHDLGMKVLVVEKSDRYGGTSALSGGALWIPNREELKGESPERALEYLRACSGNEASTDHLRAYTTNAPLLVRYLADAAGLRYYTGFMPDYYGNAPGAMTGRSMNVPIVDGTPLGEEFFRLRESHQAKRLFGRIAVDGGLEARNLLQFRSGWQLVAAKLFLRYWLDLPWRLKTPRDRRLTGGQALIGGLRLAMMKRSLPQALNTRLLRLNKKSGRVQGGVFLRNGNEISLSCERAIVLAAGGFEQNQEMRKRYLPNPTDRKWSTTARGINNGDAITAGQEIGASVEFMRYAWWVPVARFPSTLVPNVDLTEGLFFARCYPHSMCVNRLGHRFVNESCSYDQFGQAMIEDHRKTNANMPAWMIFDANFRRKYPVGGMMPSYIAPDRSLPLEWLDNVYYRANSLTELAAKIQVDPSELANSAEKMNRYASTGVDPDFGRGGSDFDLTFGDSSNRPNPCLGTIDKPPFYAICVELGDLGTKGGLRIDACARVLDEDDQPIQGLYAIGNTAGCVFASAYPGGGGTLGPAMTFGFIAANEIGKKDVRQ